MPVADCKVPTWTAITCCLLSVVLLVFLATSVSRALARAHAQWPACNRRRSLSFSWSSSSQPQPEVKLRLSSNSTNSQQTMGSKLPAAKRRSRSRSLNLLLAICGKSRAHTAPHVSTGECVAGQLCLGHLLALRSGQDPIVAAGDREASPQRAGLSSALASLWLQHKAGGKTTTMCRPHAHSAQCAKNMVIFMRSAGRKFITLLLVASAHNAPTVFGRCRRSALVRPCLSPLRLACWAPFASSPPDHKSADPINWAKPIERQNGQTECLLFE